MKKSKSVMMDALYGAGEADQIYNMLNSLDAELNYDIQTIAYDHFWAKPGLSIRDKSLITVVSLVSLGKEGQIYPHIKGFLHTGGTKEVVVNMLLYLLSKLPLGVIQNGYAALRDVLIEKNMMSIDIEEYFQENVKKRRYSLSDRDRNIINFSSCVALGNQEVTKKSIKDFLMCCDIEDLRCTLIHQIVYCGFPAAVNGFAALKAVRNDVS